MKEGAWHFQHHCQICHGLDGHNSGVPFADKMSPAVADLAEKDVQEYTDGQLKWIIENGIRFTGMPGWKGILDDQEMWHIVHFIRHLPAKGSLGAPAIYVAQPYGGMDPSQMEGYLTYYYEYHFLYITGIEHVESKNIQGIALMKLVFHPDTDMSQAMGEVVGYVGRARPSYELPVR